MDFDQVFIFLYCLFVTLRLTDADECKLLGNKCSCKTSTGTVDLSKITATLNVTGPDDNYTYELKCNGIQSPCGVTVVGNVAVCQTATKGGNTFDVGDKSTASFSGDPEADTLKLKYSAGSKNSIVIIICDRDVDGKLVSAKEEPPNTYTLSLRTKQACFGSSKKISTGSVLLIIFFLFLGIYFIAGVLFLKFARGAQGTEMIPNYDFWTSLPGYIKDGIMFTCRGCKTESSYSQI